MKRFHFCAILLGLFAFSGQAFGDYCSATGRFHIQVRFTEHRAVFEDGETENWDGGAFGYVRPDIRLCIRDTWLEWRCFEGCEDTFSCSFRNIPIPQTSTTLLLRDEDLATDDNLDDLEISLQASGRGTLVASTRWDGRDGYPNPFGGEGYRALGGAEVRLDPVGGWEPCAFVDWLDQLGAIIDGVRILDFLNDGECLLLLISKVRLGTLTGPGEHISPGPPGRAPRPGQMLDWYEWYQAATGGEFTSTLNIAEWTPSDWQGWIEDIRSDPNRRALNQCLDRHALGTGR